MASSVNILIAGDVNTGKTSLINTFISSTFSEEVTAGNLEVKIPQESVLYRKHVSILDSHENPVHLEMQLRKTDCVVILADVLRPASLSAVSTYWLPLVRDVFAAPVAASPAGDGASKPAANNKSAIIALSKTDLISAEEVGALLDHERWHAVFKEFPFVACITSCSSKSLNVNGVMDMAVRLASYPLWPLYDIEKQQCTANMCRAFKRIFRIHDRDMDGLLSDSELNSFQRNCDWDIIKREELLAIKRKIHQTFSIHFSSRVAPRESTDLAEDGLAPTGGHRGAFSSVVPVNRMIRVGEADDEAVEFGGSRDAEENADAGNQKFTRRDVGLINDRITFDGFFSLIVAITCRDLNLAIPWTALQIFNYNDSLELVIPDAVLELPPVRPNKCVALSPSAVDFLSALVMNSHSQSFGTADGCETPTNSAAHPSSDSESEYHRKVAVLESFDQLNCTPYFLAEALSVLPREVEHPWKFPDDSPPMPPPATASTIKSPSGSKELRLSKANLQRALSTSSGARAPSTPRDGRKTDSLLSRHKYPGVMSPQTDEPTSSSELRPPPHLFQGSDRTFYLGCMRDRFGSLQSVDIDSLTAHWLTQWQALARYEPVLVKSLLFRLGYVHNKMGLVMVPCNARARCAAIARSNPRSFLGLSSGEASQSATHISVSILGGSEMDRFKFGLVIAISDMELLRRDKNGRGFRASTVDDSSNAICDNGIVEQRPVFSEIDNASQQKIVGGCHLYTSDLSGTCQIFWNRPHATRTSTPFTALSSAFVLASSVPASSTDDWLKDCRANGEADIALLLFGQGDNVSLTNALNIEKNLPREMPRIFVEVETEKMTSNVASELVRSEITAHTIENNLHTPLSLPNIGPLNFENSDVRGLVEQCLKATLDTEEKAVPLKHRSKKASSVFLSIGAGLGCLTVFSLSGYFYMYPDRFTSAWLSVANDVFTPLTRGLNNWVGGESIFQRCIQVMRSLQYGTIPNRHLSCSPSTSN